MSIDPSRTVAELVLEQPSRSRVFEKLGLDYCCGGKRSLEEACERADVDVVAAVRALDSATVEPSPEPDWTHVSIARLCDHIVSVHHASLRAELPRLDTLLEKVVRAHGAEDPSLGEVRETFGAMRSELEAHMEDEEHRLFPLCRVGGPYDPGELGRLEDDHAATGAALENLRSLTHGYDLDHARCNTHRAMLDGLRELELDLHEHIHEENNVLFPRVLAAA